VAHQAILDMARCVPRDERSADLARAKGALLRVDRADLGAFRVAEDRHGHGTGHMILGELGRAAHVDDRVETGAARAPWCRSG
jgi:predicted signal transduction protein with EAL and GGDEF domain